MRLGTSHLLPFFVWSGINNAETHTQSRANIAIIGAGSAGASAAYYLHKYTEAHGFRVNITVYEKASYVGGRSHTVDVWGDSAIPVELGASIFVKVNRNLVSAAEELGLSVIESLSGSTVAKAQDKIGVWNGDRFVFIQRKGSNWWDNIKLLWRYGLSPLKANSLMKSTVGSFLKLYDPPYFPFTSLSAAVTKVGLVKVTSRTGKQFLDSAGIGTKFQKDVIQSATRVNYAQNLPGIHGLEAMVCLAASGAKAVKGGNWRIFDGMIRASGAKLHLNTAVSKVAKSKKGGYDVATTGQSKLERFDSVVLAGPYQYAGIALPDDADKPDEIPYVSLHVTLFTSPHELSSQYFNVTDTPPEMILTTLHPSDDQSTAQQNIGRAGIWSVSALKSLKSPDGSIQTLYKVFSPTPLNTTFLYQLLGVAHDSTTYKPGPIKTDQHVTWVHQKIWHSYPYLFPRVTFEKLSLSEGLWYTGGIESFISTMETSSLMGMNIARLIADKLISTTDTTGHGEEERPYKSEL